MKILSDFKFPLFPKPTKATDDDRGFLNLSKLNTYIKLNSYENKSVVCVIPTRGQIDARVVNAWFKLMTPVNHSFVRLFVTGGEVADSYNTAITGIINHPELSKYKYILTMEDDNIPPADGLLKLLNAMIESKKENKKYWALSGLYWTKGEDQGIPLFFGNTQNKKYNLEVVPLNENGITECCLIPQGFTLYDMDVFRKTPYPWFKTVEDFDSSQPILDQAVASTQDCYFFKKCFEEGLKVGVVADVKVGHLDSQTGFVW